MFGIYCSKCGLKADPEDHFCSRCGNELKLESRTDKFESSTFSSEKASEKTLEKTSEEFNLMEPVNYQDQNNKEKNNKSKKNNIFRNFRITGLICVLGLTILVFSTFTLISDKYPYGTSSAAHDKFQENKNIEICEQIAAQYYESHSYEEGDIYDCDNMAQDIWSMMKARGISAKIAVGNFDPGVQNKIEKGGKEKTLFKKLDFGNPGKISPYNYTYEDSGCLNSSTIDNLTHAWILAEVSPDSWLAIECTGGYVVYSEEDENYYRCLTFDNPKDYRNFLELYHNWKREIIDYEDERSYYNGLAEMYNNASYSEQLTLKSSVEIAKDRLQGKKQTLLKTDSELRALLQSGKN